MSRSRLYLDTALAAFQPGALKYLILFITSRCNARCQMCFNWQALDQNKGQGDMTLAQMQAIARSLPGLIQLTLSGGEPFLRDDIIEIIDAFYTHSRVRQLTLPTNGILTERITQVFPEILRGYPDLNISLDLSIDGVGEDHDRIRGVTGAYEKVMETYRRAREWKTRWPSFRLGMSAVLSSFNQDRIIGLLEHMEKNFSFDRREVMLARGSTRVPGARDVPLAVYEKSHQWIREHDRAVSKSIFARVNYQMALLMRETLIKTVRENRMIMPCLAGDKMAIIDADGTVRPCEILHVLYPQGRPDLGLPDFVMGQAGESEYNIPRILAGEKAQRVRKFIRDTKCYCTFECALFNSIVFQPRYWPALGMRVLLNP